MAIRGVTLDGMLRCRELRAARQSELIEKYSAPVVCFTMNIPGEVKYTPLVELVFTEGLKRLEQALPEARMCEVRTSFTGCEAFFVFPCDAETAKRAAVSVEENGDVSRLFDIDVIGTDGAKLSRGSERRCIVCGAPVTACARSRAHGLAEITGAAFALMRAFAAKKLAALAADALRGELEATPKPGLVDLANNGAHRDMDKAMFYASAAALEPCFEALSLAAFDGCGEETDAFMKKLREKGLDAERAMFAATGGVNTHKGAVFSLGLVIAGAAKYLMDETPVLCTVRALASAGMGDQLALALSNPVTNGERAYAKTGAKGARGEAAAGFPTAVEGLHALEGFLKRGFSASEAAALTLPVIMETLEDTNLIHRGGSEGLRFARESARAVNELPVGERLNALRLLDGEFIRRNLSPGGAADALSLALMLKSIASFTELDE